MRDEDYVLCGGKERKGCAVVCMVVGVVGCVFGRFDSRVMIRFEMRMGARMNAIAGCCQRLIDGCLEN
jgi:tetrahydromethanopterin S-methyltransferase subunit D